LKNASYKDAAPLALAATAEIKLHRSEIFADNIPPKPQAPSGRHISIRFSDDAAPDGARAF
jgi:hypothetical protein